MRRDRAYWKHTYWRIYHHWRYAAGGRRDELSDALAHACAMYVRSE